MNNWQSIKIGELCKKIGSGATPRGGANIYIENGISLIRSQNIYDEGFNYDGLAFIDEAEAKKLDNVKIQSGDVLFNITGDSIARCCIVPEDVLPARVNQHVAILRSGSKLYNKFLFAYLSNPLIKDHLVSFGSGGTRKAITKGMLQNYEIPLPPYNEQVLIGDTLQLFFDKIELNRKMKQTLEQIAQAIFKHWFIDFEFPNEDGKPYKSSGGEMVDSELGEIPKGWKIVIIKDIADKIQYGYTQSSLQEKIGPKFLRITDIQNGKIDWNKVPYCEINDKEIEKYKIKDGDIFIARTGASTGENVYINDPPESVFASYLVRFQFNEKSIARLVAAYLRTSYYFYFIDGIIGGSAQPNASAQTLASFKIILPPMHLINQFYYTLNPLDKKKISNSNQSQLLSILRDNLLPKLISGKIRLKTDV